jgi:serine/threonine-protein kinase
MQQLLAAYVTERVVPVTASRPECPEGLAALVMQCLAKEPTLRPESARAVLGALDGAITPGVASSFVRRGRLPLRPATAVAIGGILLLAATIVAARAWWGRNAPHRSMSIAVLPFDNAAGDTSQQYLADGIADGLTTSLGKVGGLRIVSRALSHRYAGERNLDMRSVSAALRTEYLVRGRLLRISGRLLVSAELTDTRDSSELWAATYEPNATNALTIPDAMARAIASATGSNGGNSRSVGRAAASTGTTNPDAYDLYLRGRYLLQRRGPHVQQAVEKFEEAIAKDSNFAPAHAGLSAALELLPYFAEVAESAVQQGAISAARRALAIDGTLAEAHTSLALAHGHAYEWQLAEDEHRRAIAVDSMDAAAHMQYGRFLHDVGRLTEARREFVRARELDPYFAVASGWLAHELWLAGRTQEALVEIRRAMELDSSIAPVRTFAMEIYHTLGNRAEVTNLVHAFRSARGRGTRCWRAGTYGWVTPRPRYDFYERSIPGSPRGRRHAPRSLSFTSR